MSAVCQQALSRERLKPGRSCSFFFRKVLSLPSALIYLTDTNARRPLLLGIYVRLCLLSHGRSFYAICRLVSSYLLC